MYTNISGNTIATPQLTTIGYILLDSKKFINLNENNNRPPKEIVTCHHGGIARNIAENLGRLGLRSNLITLTSAGRIGDLVLKRLNNAGVNVAGRIVKGGVGKFTAILDLNGNLVDSSANLPPDELLNWEFVSKYSFWLESSQYVIAEMGLCYQLLNSLFEYASSNDIPLCGIPTQLKRVGKRWDLLSRLDCLILNRKEAEFLLDSPITGPDTAMRTVKSLQARGIPTVVLTLGADGVAAVNENQQVKTYKAPYASVVDDTGAGDALVAGFVAGMMIAKEFDYCVNLGLELAKRTVEVYDTVTTDIHDLRLFY